LQTSRDDGYITLRLSDSTDNVRPHIHGTHDTQNEPLLSRPSLGFTKRVTHGGSITVQSDGYTYTYSYGPTGLAGLRHNHYALLCTVLASIGGLTFGYEQGVIANVLVMQDFMQRWPITPWQKGAMSTLFFPVP